jgi:hypothetical protein
MEANEQIEHVVGKEVNKKQFVGANFNLLWILMTPVWANASKNLK